MAVNESATNRWDAGLAGDFYHIYRGWSWELFRINNQYRASAKLEWNTLKIFDIDNHQN